MSDRAVFTGWSHAVHTGVTEDRTCRINVAAMAADLVIGDLHIQSGTGLVEAGDRVLNLSVREFELLVALATRAGRIVRREELFALVWRAPLRDGDRSVDVYVHKLRVKLEKAMPDWRYIHTHVGFGYRLQPERSHDFHESVTSR